MPTKPAKIKAKNTEIQIPHYVDICADLLNDPSVQNLSDREFKAAIYGAATGFQTPVSKHVRLSRTSNKEGIQ